MQIADGEALAITFGNGLTVTVTLAVFEQPNELVPVTEYVVVTLGVTVIAYPVCPVLHWYVFAPLAVNVDEAPGHMAEGEALTVTLGDGFTETVMLFVTWQPVNVVPVTE